MNASLLRKLRGADTVSLDVFDTAVLRVLAQPADLFLLMQPEVRRVLGAGNLDFHTLRQQAERAAHERARQTRGATEATMAEIYEVIRETTNLDSLLVQKLMQMEVDAERSVCRANPFVFGVYQWCLQNNKRVVFMSDTYLPEQVIADILRACGYRDYAALLVSSTVSKTKASGDLYAEALARFSVRPADWLHIGDNHPSDVIKPQEYGIATWHYARCVDVFTRDPQAVAVWNQEAASSVGGSVALGLVANRMVKMRPLATEQRDSGFSWRDFGYSTAGPLFVGFTEWLIEQAGQHGLQSLYFLARDGLIMKRVYETLAPLNGSAPEAHYLYASRRAMNMAAIEQINDQVMNFLWSGTSKLEAAQFIERLGIDWRPYADTFRTCGFASPRQRVATGQDYHNLRRLFHALAEPICARAREERAVLLDYLMSSGLGDGRRAGVVDIGWHGSMQRAIMEILRSKGVEVSITGFYLGTYEQAAVLTERGYPNEGYLFSRGHPKAPVDLVLTCCEIVELLFSATEGSVIRIERGAGGEFLAVRDHSDLDGYRVDSIRKLQQGALEFVEDYVRVRKDFPQLRFPKAAALAQLERVLLHPTRAEARHLGDIPHGEGFGDVYTRRLIAHPPGLLLLVTRPRKFRERMKQAFWRVGCEARMSAFHLALSRILGAMPKPVPMLSKRPG